MRELALLIFFTSLASTANAARLDATKFDVAVVNIEAGAVGADVLFTLNSRLDVIADVYVNCALLDKDGTPIDVGIAVISNLKPGETAYGKTSSSVEMERVSKATCRISTVSSAM